VKRKILIVDDEAGTRFGFSSYLSKSGYEIYEASTLAEARDAVLFQRYDTIILDMKLPDGNGLDFINAVRSSWPDIPIIVVTGAGDIPVAVDAMRRGADNFLTKPVNMEQLDIFLKKTLEVGSIRHSQLSRKRLEKTDDVYFGEDPAMLKVRETAKLAAESDAHILITGETGTGKGMMAKWIHRNSWRSEHEFVELNCSGLKGDLLAREMFGNVKGAFTSADQDREGILDISDRGTLFLDEIGDMDIGVQAQFLKVLEEKCYRRLGDVKLRKSDFRLICATNKDLAKEMQAGTFRQDMYYRLQIFPLHLPPLRERPGDIARLVSHLLVLLNCRHPDVPGEVMDLLMAYSWPGNIREMKNVLERSLILSRGGVLTLDNFSGLINTAGDITPAPGNTIHEIETSHILDVLRQYDGDVNKTAKSLGISRATIYRKLKHLKEK
jgi:DNA-binding NtrC family response regulator